MARKKNERREDPDDSADVKGGPGKESRRLASFWMDRVNEVDELQKGWVQEGNEILKRFRDIRSKGEKTNARRLNVLWSNTKTLLPALYGKAPVPYVERRFTQNDPVGRLSAIMLERTAKNEMETNGLHRNVKRAVLDLLLPGRGCVWVRYEPKDEPGDSIPASSEGNFEDDLADIEGDGEEDDELAEKLEDTGEQLLIESAPVDYIDWKDLYLFPADARVWDEVKAVGKRVYMSKREAKERFGDEIGEQLQPNNTNNKQNRAIPFSDTAVFRSLDDKCIEVFEIWNKTDRKIYWVSFGYEFLCDIKNDFLKLKKFFPIPEVLSSTLTNDTMIPVPDYIEYQDQALQIDELTKRIAMLTRACKVAGAYDASNTALKRIFQEGFENDLIPVESWAIFGDKGGVEGGISFLPIEQIQKVIETLVKIRQQMMMDLDLMTGISDVIRGTTDSRETLGGIRLKNNNAGTRLSDRQNEIAAFCKETIEIIVEVIAKNFSDKKLIEASGIMYDDEMQPETIMADMEHMFNAGLKKQQPQQQGIGGPPQGQLQLPPPGNMQPGQPPQPQMQPQPGQPPQNNVVPFPGGQNQQQGIGGPPQQQQPQITPPEFSDIVSQDDVFGIIEDKIERAIKLIRDEVPRSYRIDVETDSTIFGDAAQEREDASMFIKEVNSFLATAFELTAQNPDAVVLMGKMLLWGVRKFRVGRDLENAIDSFVKKAEKKAKDLEKNPQPSPEMMEQMAKIQQVYAQIDAQRQKAQIEQQTMQQKSQMEMVARKEELIMDNQQHQQEMQADREKTQLDLQATQAKTQVDMQKTQADLQASQIEHSQRVTQSEQEHSQSMEQSRTQHEHTMSEGSAAHNQKMAQNQQMHSQKVNQGEDAHKAKMAQSAKAHNQKLAQGKQAKKAKGAKK
jgi:hypothetical protein